MAQKISICAGLIEDEREIMLYKLYVWYKSKPLQWRRALVAAFVPIQEYLFLEPCRRVVNAAIKMGPLPGVASLPILLFAGALTAVAVGLFVYEFLVGLGSQIKNRVVAIFLILSMFAWVMIPLHFINQIGD